jgi:hypothetical protein
LGGVSKDWFLEPRLRIVSFLDLAMLVMLVVDLDRNAAETGGPWSSGIADGPKELATNRIDVKPKEVELTDDFTGETELPGRRLLKRLAHPSNSIKWSFTSLPVWITQIRLIGFLIHLPKFFARQTIEAVHR